ncbi:hypothetical protein GJAV_G00069580 [Gymnothorax javanicus]|nr:hypothetical protein GJAV_G00069580 [Gymnothorax javanicus]
MKVAGLRPQRKVPIPTKPCGGPPVQRKRSGAPRAWLKTRAPQCDSGPVRCSLRARTVHKDVSKSQPKVGARMAKGEKVVSASRSRSSKRVTPSSQFRRNASITQPAKSTKRASRNTGIKKSKDLSSSASGSSRGSASVGKEQKRKQPLGRRVVDATSGTLCNGELPSSQARGQKRARVSSPGEQNKTLDCQTCIETHETLSSVQADHNYGKPAESSSSNIQLTGSRGEPPSKKGPKHRNAITMKNQQASRRRNRFTERPQETCMSGYQTRKGSKNALDQKMESLSGSESKAGVSQRASQRVRKSLPPLEAFFQVISESNVYEPSSSANESSGAMEIKGLDGHCIPNNLESLKRDTKSSGDPQMSLRVEEAKNANGVPETEFDNLLLQNDCYLTANHESEDKGAFTPDVLEVQSEVITQVSDPLDSEVQTPKARPLQGSQEGRVETVKTSVINAAETEVPKTECRPAPPKKQMMNPQARAKARLAALAEERAAAAKKAATKQLNLLALCEEIAEDIASDTMESKTEDKVQDAAFDHPSNPETTQLRPKEDADDIPTSSGSDKTTLQPAEPQMASPVTSEEPKKRFFLSQISVPLKSNEKKTLTRYHRLRQTELKREKLTWARVKKLKTEEANCRPSNDGATEPSLSLASAPLRPAPRFVSTVRKATERTGSANKRLLPAAASLVPVGITVQKTRPVMEYKLYSPRPKYSPDDFVLDGDPKDIPTTPAFQPRPKTSEDSICLGSVPSCPAAVSQIATSDSEQRPSAEAVLTSAERSGHNTAYLDKPASGLTDTDACEEIQRLKNGDKPGQQTVTDSDSKHFSVVTCSVCGMIYSAANPEDETQHLLFHNQFISAVRYVGWKKERILGEYPDGKIILVLPDDPKYALKKVEEIREMVDSDLGFQQVDSNCLSQTKTVLFISNDKKVAGCLIAEHIQEGFRVIEEPVPEGSEGERVMFEQQRAWCCSTRPEPAVCGISRIWVFSMMRRKGIASRMIECLRNNFIYGAHLNKEEIAFSDPTPDGKLFATHYCGTSQFLVYNFVSGTRSIQPGPAQM